MQEETEMTVGRLLELLHSCPKDFKIRFNSWSEGINMDVSDSVDINSADKTVFLEELG